MDKLPTKNQFNARKHLGLECQKLLLKKFPDNNLEELLNIWKAKLHPYGTDTQFTTNTTFYKGRWFSAFCSIDISDMQQKDYKQLAKDIDEHLHVNQIKINGQIRFEKKPKGLIKTRAESIQKNTLKQIVTLGGNSWTDADIRKFISIGDLAHEISNKNINITNADDYRTKISFNEVVKLFFTIMVSDSLIQMAVAQNVKK